MNFRSTLLLSTIAHTVVVYLLVSHGVPELKTLMTKPELAHYVKVRLQLTATTLETVDEPNASEEAEPETRPRRARPKKTKPRARKADKAEVDKTEVAKVDKPPQATTKNKSQPRLTKVTQSDSKVIQTAALADPVSSKDTLAAQAVHSEQHILFTRTQRRQAKQGYWSSLARFFRSNGYAYPKQALLLGQEGKVYIVIEIAPSGLIISAAISKSSGFPILDKSALKAVLATKQVPPLPKQLKQKKRKFRIPIEYRLPT